MNRDEKFIRSRAVILIYLCFSCTTIGIAFLQSSRDSFDAARLSDDIEAPPLNRARASFSNSLSEGGSRVFQCGASQPANRGTAWLGSRRRQ